MARRVAALLILLQAGAAVVGAHEFWVSAEPWRATPGGRATLRINVGDRFPHASSITAPERVDSVRLIGPGGESRPTGALRRDKNSLATDVQLPQAAGTYIGVVSVKPRFIEIKAPDFEKYLAHEGLEAVLAERRQAGESDRAGRERYSRYGKTLLRAGAAASARHVTEPVGLPIELVPLADPTMLAPGERCRFRLVFQGQPVSGAQVAAIYATAKVGPDEWPLTARTDGQGEVEFTLADSGPWLVRAVHMVRRTGEQGPQAADWESYWASLSFALHADRPSSAR